MKKTVIYLIIISILLEICSIGVVAMDTTSISSSNVDIDRFYQIHDEMASIALDIQKMKSNYDNYDELENYQTLLSNYHSLNNELENIGAIIDTTTLENLPAPSSNETLRSLPNNLAELEEYYSEWFTFSGYEERITYIGNTYRAYIVTVTDVDPENPILVNTSAELTAQSSSESLNANSFEQLMSTTFTYSADWISQSAQLNPVASLALNVAFRGLYEAISSGTLPGVSEMNTYALTTIISSSRLMYIYIWDDITETWDYCFSTSRVIVTVENTLKYLKYNAASGRHHLEDETTSEQYSLLGYPLSELGSAAVRLYVANNYNPPTYRISYQPSKFVVERDLFNEGEISVIIEHAIVSCERPGDLWQLGGY